MQESQKPYGPKPLLSKILRIALKTVGVLALLVALAYVGLGLYIKTNKQKVLAQVTAQLNENLDGTLTIGDMEPAFFASFPRISIKLLDVHLRDRKFAQHQKEFMRAGSVEVAVNLFALLRGTISIGKIGVTDAAVYLLTDASGYSNTSVFKKNKTQSEGGSGSFPELKKFALTRVMFTADNRHRNKLFRYRIDALRGDVDLNLDGSWNSTIKLDGFAESMSFNVDRGSFMQNKALDGRFEAQYDGDGKLTLLEQPLRIGEEDFTVWAHFFLNDPEGKFDIHIKNPKILWRKASGLLARNISSRLDMFDLARPIAVSCDLDGSFSSEDDPLIYVKATVRDNTLDTPGGRVEDCNFNGIFTNHFDPKRGFNDPNAAIVLHNFSGAYGTVPFLMKRFAINDLENPLARGDFQANFPLERLNGLIDANLLSFQKGRANIAVDFTADIVRFKLEKPLLKGKVDISGAQVTYAQRGINCKDVSVGLDFTSQDLFIRNIALKTGSSSIKMDGVVRNFLNLYYTDPNKLVVNWNVYSKDFHLAEFLGFFAKGRKTVKKQKQTGDFTLELSELFEKSNVRLAMRVENLHYRKFRATDVRALVALTDDKIALEKVSLRDASGRAEVHGFMQRGGKVNTYQLQASVSDVDVRQFFSEFDNFGLESLKAENLKGRFSLEANLRGKMLESGALVPKSIDGNVSFWLKNGSLHNFDPVRNIGKYAFPHRDLNTITFRDLHGKFTVKGEQVQVEPMAISSSALNLDLSGVYSFGKGTDMRVDVPLRDPGRDKDIHDASELAKRRHRGIVLHLAAQDDPETNKVKIKLVSGKSTTSKPE